MRNPNLRHHRLWRWRPPGELGFSRVEPFVQDRDHHLGLGRAKMARDPIDPGQDMSGDLDVHQLGLFPAFTPARHQVVQPKIRVAHLYLLGIYKQFRMGALSQLRSGRSLAVYFRDREGGSYTASTAIASNFYYRIPDKMQ